MGIHTVIVEPGAFRTHFYDSSLKGTAVKIDDYSETAGKTRKENVVNKMNQTGDPDKAGEVLVKLVGFETASRRLLLGSDAVRIVTAELEERLKEIDSLRTLSGESDA